MPSKYSNFRPAADVVPASALLTFFSFSHLVNKTEIQFAEFDGCGLL